jgi:hypothetical protein
MSKKSDKKILRIGMIQNGKIVEEHLMRERGDVTIGSGMKDNTIVVPVADLPEEFTVFGSEKGGGYILNFTSEMEGRISSGGTVYSLEELVESGKARERDGMYSVKLSPSARGRVVAGDATLLFQFVTPPPKRAKPALPASMRGGWLKGIDPYLAAMVAASGLLQIGFVAFLQLQEWPEPKQSTREVYDRFVKVKPKQEEEMPEPKQKEPEKTKKSKKKSEETAQKTEQPEQDKQETQKEEQSPEEKAAEEAKRQRQLAKEVENKTILSQIGAKGGDGPTIVDQLEGGASKTSMDEALKNSEGVSTESGAESSGLGSSGSKDAEGSGKATGIGDLDQTEGAKEASEGVETGQKEEQQVQANVDLEGPQKEIGTGTLDSSSISNTLKRRSSQIQGCYERYLKKNPNASGKVVVNFTIGRAGRVTTSSATTDSVGGSVGSCVANLIGRVKFPRPDGGTVTVSKTFVFQAGG